METRQAELFAPEAERLLGFLLEQAREAKDERAVQLLELHLGLLQASKAEGIEAAFARLEAARSETGSAPDHGVEAFVATCAAGITGTPEQKQQVFALMQRMAAEQPAIQPLAQAVQNALFGAPLDTLGRGLTGEMAELWNRIAQRASGVDKR